LLQLVVFPSGRENGNDLDVIVDASMDKYFENFFEVFSF